MTEEEIASKKAEALQVALKYNFVTEITSLVIEKTDEYVPIFKEVPKKIEEYQEYDGQDAAIQCEDYEECDYFEEVCQMKMFEKTHLRGKFVELNSTVEDLATLGFDNKVASVSVFDCCWEAFTEPNFSGDSKFLVPQDYTSAIDIKEIVKKASSVKMIHCD